MSLDSEAPKDRASLRRALEISIRIGLLILLIAWSFAILQPFIVPIIWGIIIAVATYPAYRRLAGWLGDRHKLAAALSSLIMVVLLIGPAVMLAGTLVESAQEFERQIRLGLLHVPPPPESVATWPIIGDTVTEFWTLASENLEEALEEIRPQILAAASWFISTAGGVGFGILQFVLAIIIAGVLLARSESSSGAAVAVANRLMGKQGRKFVDLAHTTVKGVTLGILTVALIQAILAGLGFLAVGIPAAGLLALIALLLAVIQVGVALITIPAVVYIFSTADTTTAVLFLIWCVIVTLMDNVLKPLLMGRGSKVPMVVIFLGAIGGFLAHGIIGLFVGAVVLAIAYTLFQAWMREEAERTGATDSSPA